MAEDVNLEEQCLTIRRSIRYDGSKRDISSDQPTEKVRIVDFAGYAGRVPVMPGRAVKIECSMELYHTNYYKVKRKTKVYYEYWQTEQGEVPADYKEISFHSA